jgi:glycosyltransferase involved in cell wall biosynthesis
MKTKVAYLDYSPHFAGAERALYTIISHLDRDMFEPLLVFPFPREHHHRYDELNCEKIYLSNGLKWWMGSDRWKKPVRGTDFIKRSIFGYRLVKQLLKRGVNILHVNLLRPDCLMWLWFCRKHGIKVVGHFRSLPMEWVPPVSVQKRCDVIISVSNVVREHAMSVYQHPKNEVIYDSISLSYNKSQLTMNKKIISSVAALFPNKGHDNAIMAFDKIANKYPEYELHIVGGGHEKELLRLKAIAKATTCPERILFTEKQVSNVEEFYSQSQLILSLTKEGEAFGLVPFEAALCGTPTIVPNRGAVTELLEDGVSGIMVETLDVDAIAERIDWVLSHNDKCIEICSKTLDVINCRLTPTIMDRQIMDVYSILSK